MCSKQAIDLVVLAADGLLVSARDQDANRRYADAQLAALRAAAAVVAERSAVAPTSAPRQRLANVWQLLARLAPELAEWAALFDMSASRRTAVQAGVSTVTTREADDCLRDAASFVSRVARLLGLPERELDISTQWLVAT